MDNNWEFIDRFDKIRSSNIKLIKDRLIKYLKYKCKFLMLNYFNTLTMSPSYIYITHMPFLPQSYILWEPPNSLFLSLSLSWLIFPFALLLWCFLFCITMCMEMTICSILVRQKEKLEMRDVIFSMGGGFPMCHILSTIHHNAPSWRESSLAYRMVVLTNFFSNSGGNPLLAT